MDWFASFERIASANEWDDAKCGKMVSAYLREPAGDHFEKVDNEIIEFIQRAIIDHFSLADMRCSVYGSLAVRKQGKWKQ